MDNPNYGRFGGPALNAEVNNLRFDAAVSGSGGLAGDVLRLISPQLGAVLMALEYQHRSQQWLTKQMQADPERMRRLESFGLVAPARSLSWEPGWRLTPKGVAWYRVWSEEMARRKQFSGRGLSWLPGEEPQPGDTVITSDDIHTNIVRGGGVAPSLPAGMRSGVRVVPHNRRAVDVVYEEPADMVAALGLLEEGDAVSIQYLVGANPIETTEQRMAVIMEHLEGRGCAVRQGSGWVRTPMGTRWHQTWSGAPGSQIA